MNTMATKTQRVTLVAGDRSDGADWSRFATANRLLFFDSLPDLHTAIGFAVENTSFDTDRVIVDQKTGDAADYLELLAALPPTFLGDLVFVATDGGGFLSAVGRGGDRVLYRMKAADLAFYLDVAELVRPEAFPAEEDAAA